MSDLIWQERRCLIAGIPVMIRSRFTEIRIVTEPFLTEVEPEVCFEISEQDIAMEKSLDVLSSSENHLEAMAFFRRFCNYAARRRVILFHSCAVEVDGKAYLFAAPSGTGKSTHAVLWLTYLKEKAKMLNGDKPLLQLMDDKAVAFDSPYRGKEHLGYNGSAPVGGICFLHRGETNSIRRISSMEAIREAYLQTYMPTKVEEKKQAMETLTGILNMVPLYSLDCTISKEAAELTYNTMTGGIL